MRYWLDAKFLERGPNSPIDLISVALVCEDQRELYLQNADFPFYLTTPWLEQHVIPQLASNPSVPFDVIKDQVSDFITRECTTSEIWSYDSAYIWVVFTQIFGSHMTLPNHIPNHCFDLKQWAFQTDCGEYYYPAPPITSHHALYQARWNKALWTTIYRYIKDSQYKE